MSDTPHAGARIPLRGDCLRCDERLHQEALDAGGSLAEYVARKMILCPKCGNKRCPQATWHENACTNSNAPGQPGSDYPAVTVAEMGGAFEGGPDSVEWLREQRGGDA